jgi:mucin-19
VGSDTASSTGLTYAVTRASGEGAGNYAITPSSNTLSNYSITYTPGNFTIAGAGTALIKMNNATSVYGTPDSGSIASVQYLNNAGTAILTLNPATPGSTTYTDGIGGSITITPTTTVLANSPVGTYLDAMSNTNTGTTNAAGNFVVVTTIKGNAVVTPKPLVITSGNASTTFNNTVQTHYSISSSGLINGDTITSVTGSASGLHRGVYTDSLSNAQGTGLSNYTISYVNGSLTITPAPLTVTIIPTSAVYNGTNNLPNTTVLNGVIGGSSVTGTTNLTMSGSSVGTQTITNNGTTLSGPNAEDYEIVSSNVANNGSNNVTPSTNGTLNNISGLTGTITITPAPLSIVGASTNAVYNSKTQTNAYFTSGLLGSDTVTSVSGSGSGKFRGVYVDNLSNAQGSGLSNYTIQYINGSITITETPPPILVIPPTENPTQVIVVNPVVTNTDTNNVSSQSISLNNIAFASLGTPEVGNVVFKVTLTNGEPLPSWVSVDPVTHTLTIGEKPANAADTKLNIYIQKLVNGKLKKEAILTTQ